MIEMHTKKKQLSDDVAYGDAKLKDMIEMHTKKKQLKNAIGAKIPFAKPFKELGEKIKMVITKKNFNFESEELRKLVNGSKRNFDIEYDIILKLGQGGFGEVYQVQRRSDNKLVTTY